MGLNSDQKKQIDGFLRIAFGLDATKDLINHLDYVDDLDFDICKLGITELAKTVERLPSPNEFRLCCLLTHRIVYQINQYLDFMHKDCPLPVRACEHPEAVEVHNVRVPISGSN